MTGERDHWAEYTRAYEDAVSKTRHACPWTSCGERNGNATS